MSRIIPTWVRADLAGSGRDSCVVSRSEHRERPRRTFGCSSSSPGATSAFSAPHRPVRKRAPLESSIRRVGETHRNGASRLPVIIARWRPQAPSRKSTNTRFWWTHGPTRHGLRCSTRSRVSRLGPGGVSWRRSWDADLTRRVAHLAPREPLSPAFASRGSVAPTEWRLEGSHRFSRYSLTFRIAPLGAECCVIRAESSAAFPGPAGRAYRALVIGSGGHVLGVRSLLRTMKREAERADKSGAVRT